jgi:hypothetical protein
MAAGGCGGSATGGSGGAGDALAYLPGDAATVILISTDLDGDQWKAFDRQVVQRFEEDEDGPQSVDEYASEAAEDAGLDWKDDVKPLLGNDIAVGIEGDAMSFFGGDGESSITAARVELD